MPPLLQHCAIIGFGEAAMAFAQAWGKDAVGALRVYDAKMLDPETAGPKQEDYFRHGVSGKASLEEAAGDADLLISLVTADQALDAAQSAATAIKPGTLYCDFNSAAPQTKEAAATFIETAGGRYADVAMMSPVRPAGLDVPLLVSGKYAGEACAALAGIGFSPSRIDGPVGRASTIKMLRSVIVKGVEALTAECFLAAHSAGVAKEVAESLDANWSGVDWAARADYNLDRMIVHGVRRAAEMEEVVQTLDHLGIGSFMARAAGIRQRAIGELGLPSPAGLEAKCDLVLKRLRNAA